MTGMNSKKKLTRSLLVLLLAGCGGTEFAPPEELKGLPAPDTETKTVSAALASDVGGGWTSTSSVKRYLTWCSGSSQLTKGLYEQTCIAVTGQEPGPNLFHYQVFTVFTATKGTHWIQVQLDSIQTCTGACASPNTNPSSCGGRTYSLGGCGTRSLTAGSSVTCVSGVAGTASQGYLPTPSGPGYMGLVGKARIGADGVVFYGGTPVKRMSLQSGCSTP